MPRLPRSTQIQRSVIFHTINRGILRQEIFHNNDDARLFLNTLKKYQTKFLFSLYHWCLMPNHYHLVLELQNGQHLSKIIGACQQIYAQYYHRKYKTAGKLFQNRFKSQAIEKEKYLLACGRYVERNPLRAGLVKLPWEWQWSSAKFYALNEDDSVTTQNPLWPGPRNNQADYQKWLTDTFNAEEETKIFRNAASMIGSHEFRRRHMMYNRTNRDTSYLSIYALH